jgi:hypothetical protein
MSTRWYTGSCQCGRVKFQAAIDHEKYKDKLAAADPNAYVLVPPAAFRLVDGEADVSDVQFGLMLGLNRFCRFCGIRVFGKGHLAKLGGDFCVIGLSALDGVIDDAEHAAAAQ